jgi:hypothetical protein
LSPEDNSLPQVGRSRTPPSSGDIDKFHLEHSTTLSRIIATRSSHAVPQHIRPHIQSLKLGEIMFLPTLIMLMVLSPVLLPAVITVFHILSGQARTSTQDRVAANFPRHAASARLAAA